MLNRQDLSVAGKRAGLKSELSGDDETTRSGLFYDSIRIIKEMREHDRRCNGRTGIAVRPRCAIFENVPGAFSSNGGDDFRCVLEELARVEDSSAIIPRPTRDGWTTAGAILGGGVSTRYSIAYRVLDAQFWGVPQRRRRVFVVADFAGESAPKVLFVRGGLQGSATQSREERKGTSSNPQECVDKTRESIPIDNHPSDSRMSLSPDIVPTLSAQMGTGGNNGPMLAEPIVYGFDPGATRDAAQYIHENISNTLVNGTCPGHHKGVCCPSYSVELGAESRVGGHWNEEVAPTLRANAGDNQPHVVAAFLAENGSKARGIGYEEEVSPTIKTDGVPSVLCQEPIYALQGNFVDRETNCNGKGWRVDKAFTLDTVDRQAVCHKEPITFTTGDFTQIDVDKASTLMCRDYKDPQCVMLWNGEQIAPTLTARNAGGAQRMPDKDNSNCVLIKESEALDE